MEVPLSECSVPPVQNRCGVSPERSALVERVPRVLALSSGTFCTRQKHMGEGGGGILHDYRVIWDAAWFSISLEYWNNMHF